MQVVDHRASIISKIDFVNIFLIKVLIDYNSAIDYICFVTQKAVFKKIINLAIEEVVLTIKIIKQNAKVSAKKGIVALVMKINSGNIHMIIIFIN